MYPMRLPIRRAPMLSVMVVNLHSKWHFRIQRKIRRADCSKLRKQIDVLVRIIPYSGKQEVVAVEMHAFCGSVFGYKRLIKRNPLQMPHVYMLRLNNWRIVFANT